MTKEEAFTIATKLAKKLGRPPSGPEMAMNGLSISAIRHHFYQVGFLQKLISKQLKLKGKKPSSLEELIRQVVSG